MKKEVKNKGPGRKQRRIGAASCDLAKRGHPDNELSGLPEEGTAAPSATPTTEEGTTAPSATPTTEEGTAAQRAAATTEATTEARTKRTKREAALDRWRKIRAGELPHPDAGQRASRPSKNPLMDLPDEQRAKLFSWLRECAHEDVVQQLLRDQGVSGATAADLNEFFECEAEQHWATRISRAAQEANALVQLVEKSPVRFSSAILAALGQEAFRQIASGEVQPDAMGKIANLFLKARSDERADQMQELKREKLRRELQGKIDQALEKMAEEVDRHPVARGAFEALRQELASSMEEKT